MSRTPIHSNPSTTSPTQPGRDRDGGETSSPRDRDATTPPVEVPTPGHTPGKQHLKPQADLDDGSDVDNPRLPTGNTGTSNVESPGNPQRDVLESGQAPVIGLDP